LNPAQHLVLDLRQVAWVEETGFGKQRIPHIVAARIQRSAFAQNPHLEVGGSGTVAIRFHL
jgi:hypothetical protein